MAGSNLHFKEIIAVPARRVDCEWRARPLRDLFQAAGAGGKGRAQARAGPLGRARRWSRGRTAEGTGAEGSRTRPCDGRAGDRDMGALSDALGHDWGGSA